MPKKIGTISRFTRNPHSYACFYRASVATLGDGIAAIAAGLALEVLEKKITQILKKTGSTLHHSKDMQKQLDYLINEKSIK